jgi:hypothetical protein
MVIEKESSPDALEQKANNKLYPKVLKRGFANKRYHNLYYVNDVFFTDY